MRRRRSPLFSAIVLAGTALTAMQACGDDDNAPVKGDASTPSDSASDASKLEAGADVAADAISDACPPDSEISTPPCALIR